MENELRIGVLASGRGSNFEALARACRSGSLQAQVVCFATDNSQAPALATARGYAIPVHVVQPARRKLAAAEEQAFVDFLRAHRVELVCLAGFMRILRGPLLDNFADAILNIHPSLLPSFPGLNAQRQAIEHGVKVTGCTVHVVDASVDGGPIVLQAAVPVLDDDTSETLAARILEREHDIYAQAVGLWAERQRSAVKGVR